ncbi:MAG TPA: hypothetical protein VK152_11670 [Paludibacter sp.]|nr:hypothetical protein [Paludibacter sp.]
MAKSRKLAVNKGTTKIKAIASRALEIREGAGFTTEIISRRRYNMPYIPDAVKQAAKELKTENKSVVELPKKSFTVVRIVKPGTKRVFFYPVNENGLRLSRTNFGRKYDAENLGEWYVKNYVELKPATQVQTPSPKATNARTRGVKTNALSRRAGQNTKAGVKVAKSGVSGSVTSAVRAVIKNRKFADLNFPAGKYLYSLKKSAARFKAQKNAYLTDLIDADYVEMLNFTGDYKVTKSGTEFIKMVDQQIKNAKTDRFNPKLL